MPHTLSIPNLEDFVWSLPQWQTVSLLPDLLPSELYLPVKLVSPMEWFTEEVHLNSTTFVSHCRFADNQISQLLPLFIYVQDAEVVQLKSALVGSHLLDWDQYLVSSFMCHVSPWGPNKVLTSRDSLVLLGLSLDQWQMRRFLLLLDFTFIVLLHISRMIFDHCVEYSTGHNSRLYWVSLWSETCWNCLGFVCLINSIPLRLVYI